eukprot:gene11476-11620_t
MGCFLSKYEASSGDSHTVAALQSQVHQLQQQLAAQGGPYPPPVLHQQPPGGFTEVLFFPDPALPCHYMANCRRKNCTFAHQATNLSRFLQFLSSARVSLDICVFNITCDEISKAILAVHQRGVRVRVISDNDQATSAGSDINQLRAAGVAVETDLDQYHMHHKFAIVDQRMLANGSFNWTRQAVLYNQENVVITDNPVLVQQFARQFEVLWSKYANTRR